MKTLNFTQKQKNASIMRMILLTALTAFALQTASASETRVAWLAEVIPAVKISAVTPVDVSASDLKMEELKLKISESTVSEIVLNSSDDMALEELRLTEYENIAQVVREDEFFRFFRPQF